MGVFLCLLDDPDNDLRTIYGPKNWGAQPERYLSADALKKILKATLPHCSDWIDKNEPERYYDLLEQIELRLLMELRKILEGKQADEADATRAKAIMEMVRRAEEERSEKAVPDIKGIGD
jgi:hypothetical protein